MAGQFSPIVRPLRPGGYFNFQAQTPAPSFVNTLGILAVPFTHPWGPPNAVVQCNSFAEFLAAYGDGGASNATPSYSPGYTALLGAFRGEGLPGRGGAGVVLAYRMVGSGGAAATTVLANTTPASALTLTAVYPGSFGTSISVANIANAAAPSTMMDLQVWVQGTLVETFTYAKTDVVSLAALINNANTGSKWVTALETVTGVAMAVVSSPVALAGGNDGTTLAGGDYTTMMTAFSVQRFGVFAPHDITQSGSWSDTTGSTVLTAILAWQKGLNTNGKRFMTVVGGSASDTATSATARSALANDGNVINIGIGTFTDSTLGALYTAQLAPRLAGIIAARTEKMGLSFARLAGLTIVSGAVDSDVVKSLSGGGFMTISRDSNLEAPVRFEKGLTTFTVGTTALPVWCYSNPKFVLTMQSLENEFTEWAEAEIVGRMPIDDAAVAFVIGGLQVRLKQREANQIIQAGWTLGRNPDPPPTPQDDFVALLYGISFIRGMEQVLNTVVVS